MTNRAKKPVAVIAVLLGALLVVPVVGAGAQTGVEADREDVRRQREALAAERDVLEASDDEIHTALDRLDDAIATQQEALAEAEATAAAAAQDVVEAERALRVARGDVNRLERALVAMAVASYVHPPTADLVQSLQASSFSDALLQRAYLDARAKRDLDLLDLLEIAEATAATRAEAVEAAAAEAEVAVEVAAGAVAALREEEAKQLAFAADLQERIDASLAEAAVLAELDADLAAQIQAEQAALIARIPPPSLPAAPAVVTEAPALAEPDRAPAAPTAPVPTTPRPSATTSPPATVPPDVDPPPVDTDAPPLRTVRGITVHADIAEDLAAMLDAAAADGITLSGGGYRSTARQIELRRAHCGPSDWDIWYRPASTCSPPTAIPGRSLHEVGRAIDFTSGGRAITSRSSPAFQWLSANAAAYGFFNLPSEPWHWSTTGN